ncbi:MAG: hypothetical protein ACI4ET_13720 [Bilifractor sp.]
MNNIQIEHDLNICITRPALSKINGALDFIQGRATRRTITAGDILRAAQELTRTAHSYGIRLLDLRGSRITINLHPEKPSIAYEFNQLTTVFTLYCDGYHWRLVWLARAGIRTKHLSIHLSNDAKRMLQEAFEDGINHLPVLTSELDNYSERYYREHVNSIF